MAQFSLDSYVELFNASIECSRTGEEEGVADRCDVINKYHTLSVYEYTCRGLFERHKLLFSLQVTNSRVPYDIFGTLTSRHNYPCQE